MKTAKSNVKECLCVKGDMEYAWINESRADYIKSLSIGLTTIVNNHWQEGLFCSPRLKFYENEIPKVSYSGKTIDFLDILEDCSTYEAAEFIITTNPDIFTGMLEYHIFYPTELAEDNSYTVTVTGIFEKDGTGKCDYSSTMDRMFSIIQQVWDK